MPQNPDTLKRVAYCGNAIPFPPRSARNRWNYGRLTVYNDPYNSSVKLIEVDCGGLDRQFVYQIRNSDAQALMLPDPNELDPLLDLKSNKTEWVFGNAAQWLETYLSNSPSPYGVVFVSRTADVRWSVNGVSSADSVAHVLAAAQSPRESGTIGLGDHDCPSCCDDP